MSDPRTYLLPILADIFPAETAILEYPDIPEALRPDLPYIGIRMLSDVGQGEPLHRAIDIGPAVGPVEDVQLEESQLRDALVRVFFYGADAISRAVQLSVAYGAPLRRSALWGEQTFVPRGNVVDATRTLGSHHEPVAYIDFGISYRATFSQDVFSIQTLTLDVTGA